MKRTKVLSLANARYLVDHVDTPISRRGGWSSPDCTARKRMAHYAIELSKLDIPDGDIEAMFSDLYWDCITEDIKKGDRV